MASEFTVGVVGSGPAAEAIEAAIADTDADGSRIGVEGAENVDLLAVVAGAGRSALRRVNQAFEGTWLAVELGGIGGFAIPDVDAAVSVLGSDSGCYECLERRAVSHLEAEPEGEPRISRSDARLAGAVAGRLIARIVDGGEAGGRVVELPYIERRLLPVPGCSCHGGRDRTLGRDDGTAALEEATDRAERGIDERIGIVESVGEADSFPAPYYLATLADTSGFSDVAANRQAAGVAVDWNGAFMKAVGEALERYGAGVYRESSFREASASELPDAVPPSAFVRPDGYADPDPEAPIAWVPGENLATGEEVHLPAEFVHFPPPERRFKPSITTGLGLGSSTVDALLSGLYEVIERDATMLSWYSTFEPLELEIEDEAFGTLAKRAASEDLAVTALLVTQDVDVPVVSAAVHREGEWPRFAAGSGADLDPIAAARSALCEAVQNWMELRGMGAEAAAEEATAIGRYADFPPEAASFVDAGGEVDAESVAPAESPTGTAELEAVVDRVADAGLDAYAARLTPGDVDRLGFEAVRVLVPGAQPLFTGERYFGERARTVPRDLGFRPRLDRAPHPYP